MSGSMRVDRRGWRRTAGAVAAGLVLSFGFAGSAAAQVAPVVPGAGAVGACILGGGDTSACIEGVVAGAIGAALPGGSDGGIRVVGTIEEDTDIATEENGGFDQERD